MADIPAAAGILSAAVYRDLHFAEIVPLAEIVLPFVFLLTFILVILTTILVIYNIIDKESCQYVFQYASKIKKAR